MHVQTPRLIIWRRGKGRESILANQYNNDNLTHRGLINTANLSTAVLALGRSTCKMSGDMHRGGGTGSGGMSNPGFDPLGAGEFGSSNNSHSSGEKWKKFADKQYNEYFQSCPGAYGDSTRPLTSPGQDHLPKNVCCLKCGEEGYLERMMGNF